MEGTDLRAWLFTIMHNIYINQIRRVNNEPSFVELPEIINQSISDTSISKLGIRDLQMAISELPPDQREILLRISLLIVDEKIENQNIQDQGDIRT
ncbi:MAG: hypothetical protein KAH20_09075 [Methylococcales bacterium]|nr:hypothetical protein [Methylococcales bacterium]